MDEKMRKDGNARRKRVAGQVAGVERMLAEDRVAKVEELMDIFSRCTVAGAGGRKCVSARNAGSFG